MGQVTSGIVEEKETREDHGTVKKPGVRVNRAFVDEVFIGKEPLGRPSVCIERVTARQDHGKSVILPEPKIL